MSDSTAWQAQPQSTVNNAEFNTVHKHQIGLRRKRNKAKVSTFELVLLQCLSNKS